jgi:hypothetical protein
VGNSRAGIAVAAREHERRDHGEYCCEDDKRAAVLGSADAADQWPGGDSGSCLRTAEKASGVAATKWRTAAFPSWPALESEIRSPPARAVSLAALNWSCSFALCRIVPALSASVPFHHWASRDRYRRLRREGAIDEPWLPPQTRQRRQHRAIHRRPRRRGERVHKRCRRRPP